jgi:S-adenosylmethionine:tRNA ribosyltransferase-isomerase
MIAADSPHQRPPDARILAIDSRGRITHRPRAELVELLQPGDLVVANDAATLPASLAGTHLPSGAEIEVRLAGTASLAPAGIGELTAVVFGAGDFRTRTEDRMLPPAMRAGDRLALGPLAATVKATLGHPRLVSLELEGTREAIWAGLARHGRPIQYSHLTTPVALWDMWTPIAGLPAAFEPPSASFALDWRMVGRMRERGVRFATITLAAGLSSTGDADLDRRLPFDEPYRIPDATAGVIRRTRARGGRIVAIGTSVVRALEHSALGSGVVHAGDAVATGRLGPGSALRVVDAILSGTHEPETSHYRLLGAFVDRDTLKAADQELEHHQYRTHEFGDSVFVEKGDISVAGDHLTAALRCVRRPSTLHLRIPA